MGKSFLSSPNCHSRNSPNDKKKRLTIRHGPALPFLCWSFFAATFLGLLNHFLSRLGNAFTTREGKKSNLDKGKKLRKLSLFNFLHQTLQLKVILMHLKVFSLLLLKEKFSTKNAKLHSVEISFSKITLVKWKTLS